ncbi:MAG: hypothetical protein VB115_16365, partial [Christensenellaceae bacterium]|nr:hypothetical protein [Christensenellaceae bacterium]
AVKTHWKRSPFALPLNSSMDKTRGKCAGFPRGKYPNQRLTLDADTPNSAAIDFPLLRSRANSRPYSANLPVVR